MRASFPLVRVFPLFLALALGVRALPPGSTAFVQKFSQPHLVPKLPGDRLFLHGHLYGFATLRGDIRCSTELTHRQLVRSRRGCRAREGSWD